MVTDKRSLHLKLQEYCDCYLETDPKKELEAMSRALNDTDFRGESQEEALKFLGLAVLYGMKENARNFSLVKDQGGDLQFHIEAAGKYKLPPPPRVVGDRVFEVMRAITHLEEDRASEPLALGLRNDRIELGVAFDSQGGRKSLTVSFPHT